VDEAQFWSLIDESAAKAGGNPNAQLAVLKRLLRKLPPEEVAQFDRHFDQKVVDAYDWSLWGAAYLINGGCSDDGFAYFRAWLVSRGREVYTAALDNPDTLAAVVDPGRDDYEFEEAWYVGRTVYEELAGQQLPRSSVKQRSRPRGRNWDFDNEVQVAKRFPALSALYQR
jgi:hypothetical protein